MCVLAEEAREAMKVSVQQQLAPELTKGAQVRTVSSTVTFAEGSAPLLMFQCPQCNRIHLSGNAEEWNVYHPEG